MVVLVHGVSKTMAHRPNAVNLQPPHLAHGDLVVVKGKHHYYSFYLDLEDLNHVYYRILIDGGSHLLAM